MRAWKVGIEVEAKVVSYTDKHQFLVDTSKEKIRLYSQLLERRLFLFLDGVRLLAIKGMEIP